MLTRSLRVLAVLSLGYVLAAPSARAAHVAEHPRMAGSVLGPRLPTGPFDRPVSGGTPLPRRERTQFVLMGMDTTPHWERRGFEDLYHRLNMQLRDGEGPRSYTLFIGSGGFQFDETARRLSAEEEPFRGVLPRHNPVFDYAEDMAEIRGKAENVRRLHALGVEIGSHTVRHDNGEAWSRERWNFEFEDHARILRLVDVPAPTGFRAPFLGTNEALYQVLEAHHFTHDASQTSNSMRWPTRHPGTQVWLFGIPSVHMAGRARPMLFFDLNMEARLRQAAIDSGIEGEAEIQRFMDNTYYRLGYAAFQARYRGTRAPFLISGHGGFREPIARLMRNICRMPDVRCSTFREAAEYMRAHPEMEGAN